MVALVVASGTQKDEEEARWNWNLSQVSQQVPFLGGEGRGGEGRREGGEKGRRGGEEKRRREGKGGENGRRREGKGGESGRRSEEGRGGGKGRRKGSVGESRKNGMRTTRTIHNRSG